MKDIYDIFTKSVKNRNYESVAWILNYIDPKALHDLICEANPTLNANNDTNIIWHTKNEFIAIYWCIDNDYIIISVRYSKDSNNPVASLLKELYPKFKNITVSIEPKSLTDSFSINRCCRLSEHCQLGECVHVESPSPTSDFDGDILSSMIIK